jgi:hypothetical protein
LHPAGAAAASTRQFTRALSTTTATSANDENLNAVSEARDREQA